ncbi:hypothetical protein ACFOY4_20155 [Actinomadura syzygii]|uniref:hypothetical protein n=1 Tax=Actinomadura syzygii TaxID=1427538 RepID=UPI001651CB48|nr:hypothetical protein [Actinomadura syzygii]
MSEQNTILSRHLTSDGVVVWIRCACGRLRMDLVPNAGGRPLTAGPCPHCAVSPDRA